jgi:hypothetical protein
MLIYSSPQLVGMIVHLNFAHQDHKLIKGGCSGLLHTRPFELLVQLLL